MLFNLMSTAPASAFTSSPSSSFTFTSNPNAYIPSSIAMATAMAPPASSNIVPMPTEEDEERMGAEQGSVVSQPERAGTAVTVNSPYSYPNSNSGTRSRSGTLSAIVGRMPASPGALGSGENINARGQGQGSTTRSAIKSVRSLARIGSSAHMVSMWKKQKGKEMKKSKKAKDSEEGKKEEDGKEKKDGKEKPRKKEKEEAQAKAQAKAQPMRHSTSSFEVGPPPVTSVFLDGGPHSNINASANYEDARHEEE
ncbi:hypothetical protein CVT25_014362 [Psilocybe cyanescens]|uniref:Uncharacterized protein n=1 Tax=Psilocybe cyanescens TaxID=93625 RepID=A0A409XPM3_PSICY|nr:hypothetical protein CVT25_014362 [Psilocybe cyanescens]